MESRDGKVKTLFLPANTTSVIQPMDQGVLEALKRRYKKQLLRHIILENDSSSLPIPEIIKKLTIKDAVYWIARAWEEATAQSLAKSWNKLLVPASPESATSTSAVVQGTTPNTAVEAVQSTTAVECLALDADDIAEYDSLFHQMGFNNDGDWLSPRDWLEQDASDPGYQIMTEDEIVSAVQNEDSDSDSNSSDELSLQCPVSHAQACGAFEIALEWLESQQADPAHLMLVKKWRDQAAVKRGAALKQSKIASYFTK